MSAPFVDAHCHFDFQAFDGRREVILERCRARGVERIVIPGVRRPDWERVRAQASSSRRLFGCLGIHPWFVGEHAQSDLQALDDEIARWGEAYVAVGETGLDRIHGDLNVQWPFFEGQVDIASRHGLPLVIHSVKTHDDIHGYLRRKQYSGKLYIHGFSGSPEQGEKLVGIGAFIGAGGVITQPRAHKTRSAFARLPLESLLLETDAPDMAPAGVEAGGNSPEYLPAIFEALCELRPESAETIREQLWRNVCTLYGWDSADIDRKTD
ncbi:TatD family hydrolase [Marinobacteraceae bacterium S3BR75-40.1]